jgi:hypothetical protein
MAVFLDKLDAKSQLQNIQYIDGLIGFDMKKPAVGLNGFIWKILAIIYRIACSLAIKRE